MKTIRKIICPVDIYDFQPETAEYALTLAGALGAEITVLYVLEPLPPRYTIHYAEIEMEQKAKAKMAEIIHHFLQDKGRIVTGDAAGEIVKIAEECSGDMIVMASHGRSVLGRAFFGSVTNKVLASTKIPVLVIHPSKER